ncbi:MAG: hypothetical protein HYZ10_00300 [Ignavibacteriales bacterium]|nr:hypothetical protein [Ignavibacteriales bacterium]
MKTLSEIYLPAELQLINHLFDRIKSEIREKKKIAYVESEKNPTEEFLEYFMITDELISFNKRSGNKNKCAVKAKELRDALKYSLRTDEELTRQKFNKLFGTANFVGTALYLFIDMIKEEIANRRIVGHELTHQVFGVGTITKIEIQNEFVWFKYGEENKRLSMGHFNIAKDDQEKMVSLLIG